VPGEDPLARSLAQRAQVVLPSVTLSQLEGMLELDPELHAMLVTVEDTLRDITDRLIELARPR
jgi:hypothetical protein